jgi:hypothetical protein
MDINAKELAEILEINILDKEPILIAGSPGVGKTDIITQVCEKLKVKLIISHPVVCDPTDYKGFPIAYFNKETDRTEAHFLPFGDMQSLIDTDRLTVYFFDDFGQAPASVQAAAMQLILGRRINGFKVSDHVVFIAATNRRQDKAAVSSILEPVKSRFTILNLTSDLESWVQWANTHNIHPNLVSFIRFRPSFLSNFVPTLDITNSPNPRTIATCSRHMWRNYTKNLQYAAIAGSAGEDFANELKSYINIIASLPDVDTMLANPNSVAIPTELSQLYAICGALVYRATIDNFSDIVTIADRLPIEFSVLLIKDAINKNDELVTTTGFKKWAANNKNIIF